MPTHTNNSNTIRLFISACLIIIWLGPLLFFATASHAASALPINIEITTHLGDKQSYQEGDVISFLLNLDQNAYLLVVYQNADGQLLQIIPNQHSLNNFYQAGEYIDIPAANASFEFKVSPPFGKERLWAFASKAPFPEFEGNSLQNGIKLLKSDIESLLINIQQFKASLNSSFGEAKTTLITTYSAP